MQMLTFGTSKKCDLTMQDIFLLEHESYIALMLSCQRRFGMNKVRVLSCAACVSVLVATGAFAEILGIQPGTSDNPKDNVPAKVQRDGGAFSPGDSGPGQRDDALVGMKKEKPEPVTERQLEQNAEKTQGGGAAPAAEDLKEKSTAQSLKDMSRSGAQTGASTAMDDGTKTDRQMFQQQNSDLSAQGQQLINEQPMEKQQPANRPGNERIGSQN